MPWHILPPERINAFVGSKAVDDILLNLSAQIKGVRFTPGETCFIFDEIQDCPKARTSLKFFKEDGRFDFSSVFPLFLSFFECFFVTLTR